MKNMLVKLDHLHRDRGEHKNYLEPPPGKTYTKFPGVKTGGFSTAICECYHSSGWELVPCWWFPNPVNSPVEWKAVYPIICRGFSTIQTVVVVWDFWTVNSMVLEKRFSILPLSMQFALLCRSLHPPTVHPHDHCGWINQPESEKYNRVRRHIGNHHFPKVRGEHVKKMFETTQI